MAVIGRKELSVSQIQTLVPEIFSPSPKFTNLLRTLTQQGLPEWYILTPKYQFGIPISEGGEMENIGIFCGHLDYFTTTRYLCATYGPLVYFWAIIYIFSSFGTLHEEKSGHPVRQLVIGFFCKSIVKQSTKGYFTKQMLIANR
jgi:hypothetical protein